MKKYTFEVITITGEWKPVFCRSGNSIDPETGSSVIACSPSGRPFECYGEEAAQDSLAYFSRFAGLGKVRIA